MVLYIRNHFAKKTDLQNHLVIHSDNCVQVEPVKHHLLNFVIANVLLKVTRKLFCFSLCQFCTPDNEDFIPECKTYCQGGIYKCALTCDQGKMVCEACHDICAIYQR